MRILQPTGISARQAVLWIALFSLTATILSAVAVRFLDGDAFPTLGKAFWWAVQTVTTVGYGDLVPTTPGGQLVAAFVMLLGVAFVTVATAAITAGFVESARRQRHHEDEEDLDAGLRSLHERLDRIEAALRERP